MEVYSEEISGHMRYIQKGDKRRVEIYSEEISGHMRYTVRRS